MDENNLNAFVPEPSDIVTASYEVLLAIASEHRSRCFTWDTDESDYEPLLVDMQTASAMALVHDALSENNQVKFEEKVAKSRGGFGRMVDFTWKHVTREKGA